MITEVSRGTWEWVFKMDKVDKLAHAANRETLPLIRACNLVNNFVFFCDILYLISEL